MFNLDPGKLLVIGVVAIILLGPDRLPQVARQIGGAWRTFNEFRHRMESEVRDTMPDLPPTSEIARLARSPSALLNHLSNMASDEEPDGSFQPPNLNGEHATADADGMADGVDAPPILAEAGVETHADGDANSDAHVPPAQEPVPSMPPSPTPTRTERAPKATQPSGVAVPGDPTLN